MWGKRILCAVLACLLVLGNVPVTVLAEEPELLAEVSEFTAETEAETEEETIPETTAETVAETTEETVAETMEETVEETTEETVVEMEEETLLVESEQVNAPPEDNGEEVYIEIPFQVNPLYEGIVDPADYADWEPEVIAPSNYDLRTEYLTEEEAVETMRGYMCARVNEFTVSFTSETRYGNVEEGDEDLSPLMALAMAHTGKPTEGDYLRRQYPGWYASIHRWILSDGTYRFSITFTIPYYTTAEQEERVDEAVKQLLYQLDLDGLSDYGKIKAVYDYICKNVTYDNANLEDDSYKLKYTAYAALIDHTAVCQGYAVLLYRLALELGIDCRFISGDGNGRHGWNIIQLGDKYYNADSTWDAGRKSYLYFLKGSGFGSNHKRDEEYTTADFNAAYPMDTADYSPKATDICIAARGSCGENVYWRLDTAGTLTISGSGEMKNYNSYESVPWYSRRSSITSVVIQPGVTSLGQFCFYGCKNLTSVSISNTVTTLKWGCFMECSRLASIVLPDSITSMEGCFTYCTSLTSIQIPDGVTSLSASCFNGCTRLTSVSIPNSVTTIENNCFSDCTSLTSITIPDSVTYLESNCFGGCTSLTSITIPAGVRTLGYCFGGCTRLSEVIFTGSSTTLPSKFFKDWPGSLSRVVLPEGLTELEDECFSNCPYLTSIDIPDSVTSLGEYCFFNCTSLTSITIPNSITSLGKGCFVNCTSLTSITIADSVTALPERCFEGCTGLTSIDIPGALTNIGPFCFTGCTSLTSVTIPDSVTTFGYGWNPESIMEVVFTGSRTSLPSGLFDYRDWPALSRVVLPEGLTELEDKCFYFLSNLTSIEIPNSVTSLGKGCFQGCTSLTSITIPDSVASIGENCFLGCAGLTSVTLPKSITSIPSQCFDRCSSLKSIVIPEGVTSLGPSCFSDCTALTDVSLPDTLTDLEGGCFERCTSLTDITLPNTLTTLGNSCFYGCTGLTDITLPNALTTLGDSCFSHCTGLTDITLPNTLTTLGDDCFHLCTGLTSIDIPDGVTSLGWYCFSGCTGLTSVTIPDSVTSIGEDCFSDCGNLQMFDLSAIPGNMEFGDTLALDSLLTVPPAFQSCKWTLQTLSGEPDAGSIARVTEGNDGTHQLEIIGSGRFRLVLLDETSKAQGCTTIEATGSTEILAEQDYLFSGGKLQLSVVDLTDNSKPKVQWSVVEGAGFASISSSGVLTAKTVSAEQVVTVSSTVVGRSERAYMSFRILPKSDGIFLKMGDETLNGSRDLDMSQISNVSLSAFTPNVDEALAVIWSSSNTKVAAMDKTTGAVTLKYPGTAKITAAAADGSGVKASVTLNVSYLDTAKTLTAAFESPLPDIGLQPGQTARMMVSGTSSIDTVNFDFTSSNTSIAMVDDSGEITAGEKTGTVTITASLKDDPLKRTASVKVTVIAMQAESLTVSVDGTPISEQTLTKDAQSRSFPLTASAQNYLNEDFTPKVIWASTDTSVAQITTAKDGTMTLTIPANATGECVITAVSNDLNKIQSQLKISVRDYSPRLAAGTLTLNSCSTQGAALDLRESYDNTIEKVELVDPYAKFSFDSNTRTLYAKPGTSGTYNLKLNVTCKNDVTYPYTLQAKVTKTLPSVTVKQTEKFNLFYTDSTANLSIAAPGQTITDVQLAEHKDFKVTYDDGVATLHYTEDPADKPNTRVTLEVWLEDYNTPVPKAITISTVNTAPKLRLSSTASTINTALGDKSVSMQVLDSSGEVLDLNNENTNVTANFADAFADGDLTLTLTGTSGGTATIYVQQPNWRQSVKLTHRITVSTKLPTIKLASTTLKLDRYFTQNAAQTTASLTQSNLELGSLTAVSTAKAGTSTRTEADKISVEYDEESNCIIAKFKDPNIVPKASTYSYSYSGTLSDGTPISGGTLRVTVGGTLPKVKLSASTVKLNQQLKGDEVVEITPSVSGYSLVGFDDNYTWMTFENGKLYIRLTDDLSSGTNRLTLHANISGMNQSVAVPLTVQVYSGTPNVSLSAKGKLDTLNPDSAIIYTPKLTNCVGTVAAVELDEQYSTQFSADVVDGSIRLTLKDGVQYATNVTYKVRFRLTVCGKEILSPVTSVRVSQSSVKLTASPATLTLFQSQTAPLTGKLTISAGEIHMVTVSTKSSKELIAALGQDGFTFEGGKLTLAFENKGQLKAGKSYTLYLDVTPANNAQNLKPTQVRLTVKVSK